MEYVRKTVTYYNRVHRVQFKFILALLAFQSENKKNFRFDVSLIHSSGELVHVPSELSFTTSCLILATLKSPERMFSQLELSKGRNVFFNVRIMFAINVLSTRITIYQLRIKNYYNPLLLLKHLLFRNSKTSSDALPLQK